MSDQDRDELHVVSEPVGHILSTDCWCEPSKIYWSHNTQNKPVLMVEHRDDTPHHHKVMLLERSKNRDWITKTLDEVKLDPPRQLPPPKGSV